MTGPNIVFDGNQKTFDLESLKNFANEAKENAKVLVTKDNKVTIKGAITSRLAGTKGARLEAAHIFLATLKKEYGETIANELVKDPEVSSLLSGKPLSARRIKNVLTRAESRLAELKGRLQEINNLVREFGNLQIKKIGEKGPEAAFNLSTMPEIQNASKMMKEIGAILEKRDAKEGLTHKILSNGIPDTFLAPALREAEFILTQLGVDHKVNDKQLKAIMEDSKGVLLGYFPNDAKITPQQYAECLRNHPNALMSSLLHQQIEGDFSKEHALPSIIATLRKCQPDLAAQMKDCRLASDFQALLQRVKTEVGLYIEKEAQVKSQVDDFLQQFSKSASEKTGLEANAIHNDLRENGPLNATLNRFVAAVMKDVLLGNVALPLSPEHFKAYPDFQKATGRLEKAFDAVENLQIPRAGKNQLLEGCVFSELSIKDQLIDVLKSLDTIDSTNVALKKSFALLVQERNPQAQMKHIANFEKELQSLVDEKLIALNQAGKLQLEDIEGENERNTITVFLMTKLASSLETPHNVNLSPGLQKALLNTLNLRESVNHTFALSVLKARLVGLQEGSKLTSENIAEGVSSLISDRFNEAYSTYGEDDQMQFRTQCEAIFNERDAGHITLRECQERVTALLNDFVAKVTPIKLAEDALDFTQLKADAEAIEARFKADPDECQRALAELQNNFIEKVREDLNDVTTDIDRSANLSNEKTKTLLKEFAKLHRLTQKELDFLESVAVQTTVGKVSNALRSHVGDPQALLQDLKNFKTGFEKFFGKNLASLADADPKRAATLMQAAYITLLGENDELREAFDACAEDIDAMLQSLMTAQDSSKPGTPEHAFAVELEQFVRAYAKHFTAPELAHTGETLSLYALEQETKPNIWGLVEPLLNGTPLETSTKESLKAFLARGLAMNQALDPVKLAQLVKASATSLKRDIDATSGLDDAQKAKALERGLLEFTKHFIGVQFDPRRAPLVLANALTLALQGVGSPLADPLPVIGDEGNAVKPTFEALKADPDYAKNAVRGAKHYVFADFLSNMSDNLTDDKGPGSPDSSFGIDLARNTFILSDGTELSNDLEVAKDQLTAFATHGQTLRFSDLDEAGRTKLTILFSLLHQGCLNGSKQVGREFDPSGAQLSPYVPSGKRGEMSAANNFFLSFDDENTLHIDVDFATHNLSELMFTTSGGKTLDPKGCFLNSGVHISISETAMETMIKMPWKDASLKERSPEFPKEFEEEFLPTCPKEIQDLYEGMPGFEIDAFNSLEYHAS